jgi:hypothetical protein
MAFRLALHDVFLDRELMKRLELIALHSVVLLKWESMNCLQKRWTAGRPVRFQSKQPFTRMRK